MRSGVDLNLRPLLRLSIAKLPEFIGLFCFDLKQQSWRDNHRHIFASLVFSPPPSLDLAFFSHGLLLSAASRSLTALLGVQSRVRFAGRPRAHRWSE